MRRREFLALLGSAAVYPIAPSSLAYGVASVCAMQCRGWVKLRSPDAQPGSRLYPQEQTSSDGPVRSEKCQWATSHAWFDMKEAAH
jgi:hypothetical protein